MKPVKGGAVSASLAPTPGRKGLVSERRKREPSLGNGKYSNKEALEGRRPRPRRDFWKGGSFSRGKREGLLLSKDTTAIRRLSGNLSHRKKREGTE